MRSILCGSTSCSSGGRAIQGRTAPRPPTGSRPHSGIGAPTAPGVRDRFGESGLADQLLAKHGLQAEGIRASVLGRLRPMRAMN